MSQRYAFLFVSTCGRPFDFDPAEHANDDMGPEAAVSAAHAFLRALVSDPAPAEPQQAR